MSAISLPEHAQADLSARLSPLDKLIPPNRLEAVSRIVHAAFGDTAITAARRLPGGASAAQVFHFTVNGADYLLRMEAPATVLKDAARQYASLRIASEAGIAPRLIHADPHEAISITDFVPATQAVNGTSGLARLRAIVETVKTLHTAPPFPVRINYLDAIDQLIGAVRASGILPTAEVAPHFRHYAELAATYRQLPEDLVSSHNDLNPGNVLFVGERPWIVDWESAYVADRYIDIATVANFLAGDEAGEECVLQTYFGPVLDDYRRARFFLMQQVNRMFYAMVLLNTGALEQPGMRLAGEALNTPRLGEVRGEMASLATHQGRMRFGCIFLNEMLHQLRSSAYSGSVALVTEAGSADG